MLLYTHIYIYVVPHIYICVYNNLHTYTYVYEHLVISFIINTPCHTNVSKHVLSDYLKEINIYIIKSVNITIITI